MYVKGTSFQKYSTAFGGFTGLTNKKPGPEVILETNRVRRKTKLCFHYGLLSDNYLNTFSMCGKTKGVSSQVLLQLLEMRVWITSFFDWIYRVIIANPRYYYVKDELKSSSDSNFSRFIPRNYQII
ncbi:hypothetical protein H5410_064663 [Solanum commersonii]|uniref:Uncharacterized protein n=1 Tax=Solanum commersonii TaxID=4109 RepID=A0A9J5VYR2_SOLCO|nr:hypothetical protein H5410_064663 [Solanum commersonii]